MLCDNCGKNMATTHFKQSINGKVTELHLCAECAAEQGLDTAFSNFGFDIGDFWGPLFAEPAKRMREDTVRCEGCGRSFREIVESGRPGCPTCYQTFYDRLLPSIQRIHGKAQHTGKVAEKADDKSKTEYKLQQLRDQLNKCIADQEYEKCAQLRDKIKELEKGEKKK